MPSCRCSCHGTERANHRAVLHRGADWPSVFKWAQRARYTVPEVDVTDAVAAVIACDGCRVGHIDVLLIKTIWGTPAYVPAPVPYHSHGATDGGEGDE